MAKSNKDTKSKKSFKKTAAAEAVTKTNPTALLISEPTRKHLDELDREIMPKKSTLTPEDKRKMQTDFDPPEGYKRNPEYIQVKSRRVQLVLQPAVFDAMAKAADAAGLSRNEYIHQVLKRELGVEA